MSSPSRSDSRVFPVLVLDMSRHAHPSLFPFHAQPPLSFRFSRRTSHPGVEDCQPNGRLNVAVSRASFERTSTTQTRTGESFSRCPEIKDSVAVVGLRTVGATTHPTRPTSPFSRLRVVQGRVTCGSLPERPAPKARVLVTLNPRKGGTFVPGVAPRAHVRGACRRASAGGRIRPSG